jgi:uncharacterized protein HemY
MGTKLINRGQNEAGKKCWELAAHYNYDDANYNLGVLACNDNKWKEASKYLKPPAYRHHAEAQNHLGRYYCFQEKPKKAMLWFQRALKNNSPFALCNLQKLQAYLERNPT